MSRWSLAVTITLVSWLVGNAYAVPSVTFNESPEPIGQLDCADRLNDVLNLTVSANNDQTTDSYVLELVVFTEGNTSCLSTLQECPQITADDEGICGCLESRDGSPTSFVWSGALASLSADFEEVLCAGSTVLSFRADINYIDTAIESETSEVVTLETQLDAPPAPVNPPVVRGAESALVISLDASDRSVANVDRHEVCVRRVSSSATDDDGNTDTETDSAGSLADLRAGFSTCKETTQLKSGDYRYEGLENDVSYEIIVAAYDTAGNRSPNSEIVRATPASLFDFAELYHSRLNGAEGESGGCSTSMGSHHQSTLVWLFGILLVLGRRRATS